MTDDSTDDNLWSPPWGRVRQAQDHFDSLTQDLKAYRKRHENRSIRRIEDNADDASDPHIKVTWAFDIEEPIPARWALWLGDILHNLRSALDHMIYALNVQEIGRPLTEDEARPLAFPVCRNPSDFRGRVHNLGTVPSGVEAVVKRLQPTETERMSLWPIHELDRINKHRTLHVVQHLPYDFDLEVVPEPDGMEVTYLNSGPLKYGAVVASAQWTRPRHAMHMDVTPHIAYLESIQETDRTEELPLSPFLVHAVIDTAFCINELSAYLK